MRLFIQTQCEENYGAHAWDGTGECPQYWKMKGGSEYVFPLTIEQAAKGYAFLSKIVNRLRPQVERDDNYWREYVHDWSLLDKGELTPDEQFHRDDPSYNYPPKVLGLLVNP